MKNKIVLMLLTITMVGVITACGQKDTPVEETKPDVSVEQEVGPTPEAEEPTDGVEGEEPVEDTVSENDTGEDSVDVESDGGTAVVGSIDLDFEAFEEDEAKDHQFGDIGYVAQYKDMRETTGQNSTSTKDIWKYLTEEGSIQVEPLDGLWEYGVSGYTGRWAYPTLLENEATKDLYLYDWTDNFAYYIADEGENNHAILMCSGYDVFDKYSSGGGEDELGLSFSKYRDITVGDNTYEIWQSTDKGVVPEGEEEVEEVGTSASYLYKIDGFSIVIEFDSEEGDVDELLNKVVEAIVVTE